MDRLNVARILLGGIVAGIVLNIGEFVLNEVLFKKNIQEMSEKLHIPTPGASFIAVATALTILLGVMLVFIYAMIRSRVGPGPKTAIIAALIGWFCIYVYAGVLNGVIFSISPGLLLIGIAWGLAEYSVATLAGAWLYREK